MSRPRTTTRNPPGRSAPRALIWLVVIALCAAYSVWHFRLRHPAPPRVSLDSIDPALRQLIETCRVAVARSPRSGPAWGRLGQALQAAEFTPEAKFCYSNAIPRDPREFRWPYLLGFLEQQGNPALAVIHLQQATELAGPRTDSPRYQFARTLVELGRLDEAAPQLAQLLAANPAHAAASLEMARIHLARTNLRAATLSLQPALTNEFTMKQASLLGAQIAQRNQQPEIAAQLSRRAAALPRAFDWPDLALREVQSLRTDRVHFADQVNGYLLQARLPEAEAALNKLLSLHPDDPEGLLLLGRLRYLQNRCREAEYAYRKHLLAQPDSLNGLVQLGLALLCQQQWTNAAAALEKAVALKPDFAQAHNNLGLARSRAGDPAGAIRAFRDALRSNPGDLTAHMGLAEELANLGQLDAARDHLRSAAAINPADPRVLRAQQQLQIK